MQQLLLLCEACRSEDARLSLLRLRLWGGVRRTDRWWDPKVGLLPAGGGVKAVDACRKTANVSFEGL